MDKPEALKVPLFRTLVEQLDAAGRHVDSPVGPIAEDVLQRKDGPRRISNLWHLVELLVEAAVTPRTRAVFLGYPSATGGFFVRSGGGMLRAVIEDGTNVAVGEGLTWNVGVGYDIPVGSIALTPYVTFLNSMNVALVLNDVSTDFDINPNILHAGIALTIP